MHRVAVRAARAATAAPVTTGMAMGRSAVLVARVPTRTLAAQPSVAAGGDKDAVVVVAADASKRASDAVASSSGGQGAPSSAASAAPAPAPAAAEASGSGSGGGSVWGRFVAFLTGMGVSSIFFSYMLASDMATSTETLEHKLADFRKDLIVTNTELRQRVATLEHQIAALKKH